jgi:hypothetical protein
MVQAVDGGTRPVRPEARAPRKHSKPNPLPARLMVGVGALAALSVIAAGIGRLPGVSEESAPSGTGLDPDVTMLATTAVPVGKTRVERPVRYVRLKPGQKAPPGATVIREAAPAPRVVVRWVTSTSSSSSARAPVARTRQSGG